MELEKTITTPVGNAEVVIKTMLTGAERESVDQAEMQYIATKDGQTFEVKDMAKVGTAKKHKLLEVSVKSINGDATDVLKRLQKMYEPDYEFVHSQILDAQKKMKASISAT